MGAVEVAEPAEESKPGDAEVALKAVAEEGATALGRASEELRGDREFMLAAAACCPLSQALPFFSEALSAELYRDRAFVLKAVQEIGAHVLKDASAELRNDLGFMMEAGACCSPGEAMKYAGDELRAELDDNSQSDEEE